MKDLAIILTGVLSIIALICFLVWLAVSFKYDQRAELYDRWTQSTGDQVVRIIEAFCDE